MTFFVPKCWYFLTFFSSTKKKYPMEKAKRIDVCSRFFFPAVFAVFNVAYWFNYLLQARQEFLKTQKRMNEWAKKRNNNWKQKDSKLDYQKAKIILYMNSKKKPCL